jgi:hypothetical protein
MVKRKERFILFSLRIFFCLSAERCFLRGGATDDAGQRVESSQDEYIKNSAQVRRLAPIPALP